MRGEPRTYKVLCSHVGSTWAVRIPELEREASAARLSQVEAVARALVATYGPDEPGTVAFTVELMPDALSSALADAATARETAVRSPLHEVHTRRRLARQMYVEGLEVADIAAALGVPAGHVQLLIDDRAEPAPPSRPAASLAPATSVSTSVLTPPLRSGGRGPDARPRTRPRAPARHALAQLDGPDRPVEIRYRHEALFHRGDDALLAATVPFIQEGLALGHAVLVAVPEPRLALLRDALGSGAREATLVDMARLGRNPARIIPAWRQFLDEHGRHGRPVCVVGEPLWPGRYPAEREECALHEALLNLAFEPATRLSLRCLYDVARLDPTDVRRAEANHPWLVEGSRCVRSRTYFGPAAGAAAVARDLPAPPVEAEVLLFSHHNVRDVREQVIGHAIDAGLGPVRTDDLTLAMWELAVNSVQHGGGEGVLRIWREPEGLVCEIRDSGCIDDPLAGRRTPGVGALDQRGMWLVNQLCDLVQLRTHAHGTTVRVFSWL
jgi:anti-sigma regulatory factor (Ser/Thr protein kinase)